MDLICYLSNGYPSIERSKQIAKEYVKAGCDIIEIDFPAREPFLESEFIASRMKKALEACDDYNAYMDGMAELKRNLPDTRFIVLCYEATILEIGYEKFLEFCRDNGFEDMILAGPSDEQVKKRLIADGMRVSCYVRFIMDPQEIEYATRSNGFVYMQAKPNEGTNPSYPTLKDCIAHLHSQGIDRPVYCGVGVHSPDDIRMVREAGADGAFIGTAVLKLHDDIPAMAKTIAQFKAEC